MKKRMTTLLLAAALLCCCLVSVPVLPVAAAEDFSGGSGSAEEPFLLATADDLLALSELSGYGADFAQQHFLLTADIDLSGAAWTPIGLTLPFAGTLDGGGHTVSGLTLSGDAADLGLFGTLSGATVRSLTVEGELTDMTAGSDVNAGGIAARSNGAVLSDVHVRMDVGGAKLKGQGRIGGLIGRGDGDTTLEDCSYTGEMTISSATYLLVGGLVGAMEAGALTVTGCTVRGSFALTQDAATLRLGGAAGKSLNGSISGTLVEAAISGSTAEGAILRMGGMVGDQYATVVEGAPGLTLSGCAFLGSVTAVQGSAVVGGMVGNANASGACGLSGCFSAADGVTITANLKHYVIENSVGMDTLPQMRPGAAVLGEQPTALRWSAELDSEGFDALGESFGQDAVSVGMLIATGEAVADAGAFTKEALEAAGAEVLDVPYTADAWYTQTASTYVFTGGIENLDGEELSTQYTALAYLTLRLSDGLTVTVYAAAEESNLRSAEYVSYMAYHDRAEAAEEAYPVEIPADDAVALGQSVTYSPYAREMLTVLKALFGSFAPAKD